MTRVCPLIELIQLIYRKNIQRSSRHERGHNRWHKAQQPRYADDTTLLCFCATDLQELLNAVNKAGKPYGMEMNIIITKAMVVRKTTPTPKINITL